MRDHIVWRRDPPAGCPWCRALSGEQVSGHVLASLLTAAVVLRSAVADEAPPRV
jgi:hypothetical protein